MVPRYTFKKVVGRALDSKIDTNLISKASDLYMSIKSEVLYT